MINIELEFITELKKQILFEQKKQIRSGIYGLTQRILAYNSNRIEGSSLTERQTASIFETGTIFGEEDTVYRTKDIEEMTGHFRMFNYTLRHLDEPLSVDMIKQMHYQLKTGVFEDMANGYPCGEFKNRRNTVAGITTSLPQDVPEHMDALLREYNRKPEHDLESLAMFHAGYEQIHPFQDGNGRTGRMILFKESLRNGMIPVIIRDSRKDIYYRCLRNMEENNGPRQFAEFFKQEQDAYFEAAKGFVLPFTLLQKYEEQVQVSRKNT